MEAQKSESFETSLKAAFALHNAGRHAEAEAGCRALLAQNARDGQLLFLLGMILQKTSRSDEALKFLGMAAALPAPSARIFNGLGFVHQSRKEYARALEYYERAIALGWRAADTFYSAGNACYRLGEMERAVTMFQNAVALKPADAASWNNLGKCLNELNRLPEAIAAYERAVTAKPDYALAHYGRAIALLTAGQLAEGFREYNQWRHCGIKPREFSQPAWRGESVPDKILFLHAEQGFGDAIQNVRFLPQARERVAKIILECRPELKTLFVHSGCADEVIAYGETIPPFDCFTSLASLSGILGVTLATIPQPVPYLKLGFGGKLSPSQTKQLKVGLAWAGNSTHHNDAARSLRLEELLPLLSTSDTIFYSLQQPVPTRDEECFQSVKTLLNSRAPFNDFLETSAFVAEMDLIITVDTAIAHLAGALAKPVWTLLPFAADWRWFLERTDTPWYPTMRLFRQKQRGQWHSVIAQVASALNDFSRAKNSGTAAGVSLKP